MPSIGIALRATLAASGAAAGNGGTAPAAPSLLVADEASTSAIDLTWNDNSDDETEFDLQYDTVDTFTSPTTVNPAADATTHQATGLSADTTYYFRIRATNAAGDSDWSNTASATTFASAAASGAVIDLDSEAGLFQDVAGTTAVTTDGDAVGRWEDQSGNGNHFTAITDGSNRPTYKENIVNGLPVVRADGVDDHLRSASNISLTDCTIFFVISPKENGNTTRLLYHFDGSDGWFIRSGGANMLSVPGNTNQAGAIAPDVFSIVTLVRGSGAIKLRVNGVEIASTSLTVPTTNDEIYMFVDSVLSNDTEADAAKLLVYGSELSAADMATTERYLAGRYAIALEDAGERIVWLKSDTEVYEEIAASTLATDDADTVGYWKDQSGKGWHFTAAADNTTRPTLKTNIVNSLPVIRGDGSNDLLSAITDVAVKDFTLLMVEIPRTLSDGTTRVIYQFDSTNGWWLSNTVEGHSGTGGFRSTDSTNTEIDVSVDLDVASIIAIERDGSTLTTYRNGRQVATKSLAATPNVTVDEIFLFASNAATQHSQVDIAEIILWRGVDSTRRQRDENYLSSRYSISLPSALSWTQLADMPAAREQASFEVLNDILYVAGGIQSGGGETNTLYAYDPSTDTWDATLANMPGSRQSGVMRAVDGKLYYIGGLSGGGTTFNDNCWEYDPVGDSWSVKATMPTAREDMGSAVISGVIYVFGGIVSGGTVTAVLQAFDPGTNTWDNTLTSMPGGKELGDFGATHDGKAYAIGGASSHASYPDFPMDSNVYEYDPGTDTWDTKATAIPAPKAYKDVSVIGSDMYIFGGAVLNNDRNVNSVWKYDAAGDAWTYLGTTPQPISHHGAAVHDGSIYMAGGQTDGDTQVDELWRLDP